MLFRSPWYAIGVEAAQQGLAEFLRRGNRKRKPDFWSMALFTLAMSRANAAGNSPGVTVSMRLKVARFRSVPVQRGVRQAPCCEPSLYAACSSRQVCRIRGHEPLGASSQRL